jgi:hypothetical protein
MVADVFSFFREEPYVTLSFLRRAFFIGKIRINNKGGRKDDRKE